MLDLVRVSERQKKWPMVVIQNKLIKDANKYQW